MYRDFLILLASSALFLTGFFPYLISILKKEPDTRPHIWSWLGWFAITAIGGSAMLSEGFSGAAVLVLVNSLACLVVVVVSWIKRVGVLRPDKYDWVFLVLGILGLILWQALQQPVAAVVCAVMADGMFGIMTIRKTLKDPKSEPVFPWSMAALSGLFGIFLITEWSVLQAAYPLYLAAYDAVMFLIVVLGRRPEAD